MADWPRYDTPTRKTWTDNKGVAGPRVWWHIELSTTLNRPAIPGHQKAHTTRFREGAIVKGRERDAHDAALRKLTAKVNAAIRADRDAAARANRKR